MWINVDRVARALGTAVLVAGCGACFPESPPSFDGGTGRFPDFDGGFESRDAGEFDGAPMLPTVPWISGTLALPRAVSASPPVSTCGTARGVAATYATDGAHAMCASGRYLYLADGHTIARLGLDTIGTYGVETLTGSDDNFLGGVPGCASDYVLLALDSPRSQASAIVEFANVMQPGVVRWSDQRSARGVDAYSVRSLTASDALSAWIYVGSDGGRGLYVAGPHGESPHVLDPATTASDLHADGSHLVYSDAGDIFLWTYGEATPENLTHDDPAQAFPWISGTHVVWVDARNGSGASAGQLVNPDIYGMDLATRMPVRLNQDPMDQPAYQYAPVVAGDWVVWVDTRNSPSPDPSGLLGYRREIYGYNFATAREYPIVSGDIVANDPLIVGGDVFVTCQQAMGAGDPSLFTAPLPTP